MLIKRPADIRSSEITDENLYRNRRQFLKTSGWAALASAGAAFLGSGCNSPSTVSAAPQRGEFDTDEELTPEDAVTGYNNFYEFGTGKDDPARNAHTLRPRPWTVEVDGLVAKPATYDLDDLISGAPAEGSDLELHGAKSRRRSRPAPFVKMGCTEVHDQFGADMAIGQTIEANCAQVFYASSADLNPGSRPGPSLPVGYPGGRESK